jgi:hypothetical protein
LRSGTIRGSDARGRPKTSRTTVEDFRPSAVAVVMRRFTSPVGSGTLTEKRLCLIGLDATARPLAETTTQRVPEAARPRIRPYET